ncbi:MAG: mechanosensitive ion channel protein MscS [Myxococcales bacterium]|nr:mechanosensitive ion channel protein MscS [Myxococcales bacterium]
MPEIPEFIKPYMPQIIAFAHAALVCVFILILGWFISKWVHRLAHKALKRTKAEESLSRFLASMAQYTVLAATVIAAIDRVGVPTTSVVALLGSAGIAVGLALQGNLSHFASGVMILFFRPFVVDDRVTLSGHTGVVKEVGLFATILRTPNHDRIIIPNGAITGNTIVNHTALGTSRAIIDIGVAYGSDLAQVQEVLREAASGAEHVLADPPPGVAFVEFGASSLNFKVMPWCKSEHFVPVQHHVKVAIYNALNEAEIEIPFDQLVVYHDHLNPPEPGDTLESGDDASDAG